MKITETITITRNCCDYGKGDLIRRSLDFHRRECKHCGKQWIYRRGLGEMDYGWEAVGTSEVSTARIHPHSDNPG